MTSGVQLLPFSYTRLSDWERCPFYAYNVHVLKKRVESPHMKRGTLIHEHAQRLVQNKRMKFTPDTVRYEREFEEVRKEKTVFTEEKFGVTSAWKSTEFHGSAVWCRGIYDLVIVTPTVLRVIDHKTGKQYDSHHDQLKLYAATASVRWSAPSIVAEAWYLDFPPDRRLELKFSQNDVKKIRKDFEVRVMKMAKDTKLKPTPNQYCFNCQFNKKLGGTCDAGR